MRLALLCICFWFGILLVSCDSGQPPTRIAPAKWGSQVKLMSDQYWNDALPVSMP